MLECVFCFSAGSFAHCNFIVEPWPHSFGAGRIQKKRAIAKTVIRKAPHRSRVVMEPILLGGCQGLTRGFAHLPKIKTLGEMFRTRFLPDTVEQRVCLLVLSRGLGGLA